MAMSNVCGLLMVSDRTRLSDHSQGTGGSAMKFSTSLLVSNPATLNIRHCWLTTVNLEFRPHEDSHSMLLLSMCNICNFSNVRLASDASDVSGWARVCNSTFFEQQVFTSVFLVQQVPG